MMFKFRQSTSKNYQTTHSLQFCKLETDGQVKILGLKLQPHPNRFPVYFVSAFLQVQGAYSGQLGKELIYKP